MLISINFVSAQFYGSLSISDALRAVDPSTMVLGIIFVIAALLINVGLSRGGPLKYNQTAKGIISISLALLIIWGIDRAGFDYYGFFNGIVFFIPQGLLETIWPLLFLLSILFVGWKFGWKSIFLVLGAFLVGIDLFFAYESGLLLILGGFFILIWLILLLKKKPGLRGNIPPYRPSNKRNFSYTNASEILNDYIPSSKDFKRGARWFGGKAKQSAGWVGGKTKQSTGWAKSKWKQKQYAKAQGAAMKEDAAREQAKQQQAATKEQAQASKQAQREEQTQQAQQETAQKQQEAQEKQKTQQQKQLVMDFKALKKQIIDTQRQNPRDPRLEGWIKTLKQMRKQMKS